MPIAKHKATLKPELVLVLGPQGATSCLKAIWNRPTLMPRVFDADLQQLERIPLKIAPIFRNLHLLDSPYQFQDDLEAMSEVLSFSHLGVIVDQGLIDTIGVGEAIEAFFKSISSGVRRVSVIPIGASSKGILADLSAIQDGAEAIYIASAEQLSAEERAKLISGLNQLKIPR